MKPVEQFAVLLLFFSVAVFTLAASVFRPYHNWDMIMYIAAAKSFEERDVKSLHTFTYEQLRYSVSKVEYKQLVQDSYREAISKDPSAFGEQLPFYQIRPLYTGSIYLLYKTGIDISFATHIISGVAVVLALFFLYLMSVSLLNKSLIYSIPLLVLVFNVPDLARYSTPDGMAFLAIILAAYLYLKKRIQQLLIFLPTMLFIRTDLILFTIPLLLLIVVCEKSIRWKAILSIVMSVIVLISIGVYWGNTGWSTIFYFALVQKLTHPISQPPTLTAQHYFYTLFMGVRGLPFNQSLILYLLMTVYSLYLIKFHSKITSVVASKSSSLSLLVICFFFISSHFIAFPVASDRFFSAPYVVGAFIFLILLGDHFKASNSAQMGASQGSDSN
jgi:hypothetical protein